MSRPTDLRIESPFRPTDWRWEKARLMREDPRIAALLRNQNDPWTAKTKRFQEAHENCNDDYDHLVLMKRWPSLCQAYEIRYRETEKKNLRYELEARILSGDPFERIAQRSGVVTDVVIWYEKIFFNVVDKLSNNSYIAHCVLGESVQAGLNERDFDLLWKMYGYMGGPIILDSMIDKFFDVMKPESDGQSHDFYKDDTKKMFAMKSSISARTIAVNSYTHQTILEVHQRFEEIQKLADGSGGAGDMMSGNILGMLQCVPWTIGNQHVLIAADDPSRIVGRLRSEILAADECAAELRADDLMQMSVGQRPTRVRAIPATKFPEKPDVVKQGS